MKNDIKLLTYRQPTPNIGPPWTRGRYETVDYTIIGNRWKNTMIDCETDVFANIPSDHFIMKYKIRTKLKGKQKANKTLKKYEKCDTTQKEKFNEELQETLIEKHSNNPEHTTITYETFNDIIKAATEKHIPKITAKNNKIRLSSKTQELIKEREDALIYMNGEEVGRLTKQIRKSKQKDKERDTLNALDKDLDIRDRWLGLRQLKNTYKPMTYHQKDRHGKHVPRDERAGKAAEYWAFEIWKKQEGTRQKKKQ